MKNSKRISSVYVTSDATITPISREPIAQIDSSKWPTCSINELYEHLSILRQRLFIVASLGNTELTKQMDMAILTLQEYISYRENNR